MHCFLWSLVASSQIVFSSRKITAVQIFYYEFFKNYPRRGVFRNVNLSNLKNVLQRHLRIGRAGDCHLRIPEGTILKMFQLSANHGGAIVHSMYLPVCPIRLWIRHCCKIFSFREIFCWHRQIEKMQDFSNIYHQIIDVLLLIRSHKSKAQAMARAMCVEYR